MVRLISAGKSAVLGGQINADYYIDCRVVRNPFRIFPHKTGDDVEVQGWMASNNFKFLRAAADMIQLGIETAPTRNSYKNTPLTVCFFCKAGVHRSRSSKHVVAQMLKSKGVEVEVI